MNNKGFSLVELMIVVAIIGILAAIAIPSYQGYIIHADLARFLANTRAFSLAVNEYNQEIGLTTGDGMALCNSTDFTSGTFNGAGGHGCATGYGDNIWVSQTASVNPNYFFEMDWVLNYDNTITEYCTTSYPGGFSNCADINNLPRYYWQPTGTPPPGVRIR